MVGHGNGSEPLCHRFFTHQGHRMVSVMRIIGMDVHIHQIFVRHSNTPKIHLYIVNNNIKLTIIQEVFT